MQPGRREQMQDWHQEHSTTLLLLSSHLVPLADTIGAGKGLGAIKVKSVLLGEMSQCGLTPVKAVSRSRWLGGTGKPRSLRLSKLRFQPWAAHHQHCAQHGLMDELQPRINSPPLSSVLC